MLGAVGLVLDAGAGGAAAQLRHGLHEPAHHRATSCKQVTNDDAHDGDDDDGLVRALAKGSKTTVMEKNLGGIPLTVEKYVPCHTL